MNQHKLWDYNKNDRDLIMIFSNCHDVQLITPCQEDPKIVKYNISSDIRYFKILASSVLIICAQYTGSDAVAKILCAPLKWCKILPRSYQDSVNSMMYARLSSKMVYYILISWAWNVLKVFLNWWDCLL